MEYISDSRINFCLPFFFLQKKVGLRIFFRSFFFLLCQILCDDNKGEGRVRYIIILSLSDSMI